MFWTEYILFGITILGVIFAVYRTFKAPDDDAKLHLAVLDVKMDNTDKIILKMVTNDLPHIDAQLQDLRITNARHDTLVAEKFATLFAIIDERLPRK